MNKNSTVILARVAIVAALYALLCYVLAGVAFGPVQFRASEGLTLLPLLFPETVWALTLGCALANLTSAYGILDVLIGSFTTLIAALCTYAVGRKIKNQVLKVVLGGLPPVLFNALLLPLIWILLDMETAYFSVALSIFLTQALAVYAIGVPLHLALCRLKKRGILGNL